MAFNKDYILIISILTTTDGFATNASNFMYFEGGPGVV